MTAQNGVQLHPVEVLGNAAVVVGAEELPIEDVVPAPGLVSMLLPNVPEGPGDTEPDPAAPNVVPLLVPGLPGVAVPAVGGATDVPGLLATAPVLGVDGPDIPDGPDMPGDPEAAGLLLPIPILGMLAQGLPGVAVPGVCAATRPAKLASAVAAIAAVNFLVTRFMFETPEKLISRGRRPRPKWMQVRCGRSWPTAYIFVNVCPAIAPA
ncbi:MAG TPA: hypothetical protein VN649_01735 [Ramlibacter sp.]|nr:hypothetical protein [Ramlibacter sp.]